MPEDKMQQNIDFLEKIIEKTHDDAEIATAVADILPQEHIGTLPTRLSELIQQCSRLEIRFRILKNLAHAEIPEPGTPKQDEFVPVVIAHANSGFGTEQLVGHYLFLLR